MKINHSKLILMLFFALSIFLSIVCNGCGQVFEQQETIVTVSSELSETKTEVEIETTELETTESVSNEVPPESETTTETPEAVATEVPNVEPTEAPKKEVAEEPSEMDIISEQLGLSVDNIEIDLPNVNDTYEILFVSDMHILKVDDTVVEGQLDNYKMRQDIMFKTQTGICSADAWLQLSSILDDFSADHIIFGGDMMDFVSETNVQIFKEGLGQILTPYTYLRADHDLGTWHSGGAMTEEGALYMHTNICDYEDVYILEYPEFYIIGWNNSTSQLSGQGLQRILSVWENEKPIILATHVPINSIVDKSLAEAASNVDPEGRIKLWGDGCLYQPRENTSTFMGMLYKENSPVQAVLSGHLHFKHTLQLTNQAIEYVFAPAFAGNIAKITIK